MRIAAYSPTSDRLEKCGAGSVTGTSVYDELQNIPIQNLKGTITTPLFLSDLEDGIYKIHGNYYLTGDTSQTQFIEGSNCLFFISKETGRYLKVSPYGVTEYTVSEDGSVTENPVGDVGNIEEIIRQEVKNYFDNGGVTQDIEKIVDNRIDERFDFATEEDILNLFVADAPDTTE